jgi:predicted ATPase
VSLSPKAFELLTFLALHRGDLVSSEELLSHLWPDTFVQPENLKKYVLEIRKVLGDDAKQARYVETLPRRGYRLICAIDTIGNAANLDKGTAADRQLFGRTESLETLGAHLRQALTGEAQVVFVTGDAGIGKTALVDAFQRQAAVSSAVQFLRGQCIEGHGGQEPYYPILEALSDYCRADANGDTMATLAENAPSWLAQFPGLLAALPEEIRLALKRERESTSRQRMLREICAALEVLSSHRPLVVLVEDLHRSDPSTVDFFEAIARRRSRARLLLIGTYRPIDVVVAEHPLKTMKRELVLHSLCHEITLSVLPIHEAGAYLAKIGGTAEPPNELVHVIHRHSDGNPLFMSAALDYVISQRLVSAQGSHWHMNTSIEEIEAEIPDGLRELIDLRLRRLSEQERTLLEVASVAGIAFSSFEVAAATGVLREVVESQLERLTSLHRIFRHASRTVAGELPGGMFEFSHAVYREVFYRNLPLSRKRQLHLKVALALESQLGHPAAPRLAFHFERAGDWTRAILYLKGTADRATAMLASAEARAALRQALSLAANLTGSRNEVEMELLERLCSIEQAAGLFNDAEESGRSMLEMAKESGSTDWHLRALLRLVRVHGWINRSSCTPLLRQAESLTSVSLESPLLNEMRIEANFWQMASGWSESAAAQADAAFQNLQSSADASTVARCSVIHSKLLQLRSRYDEARNYLARALPLLNKAFDSYTPYLALHLWEESLLHLGEWGEFQRSNSAMQEMAKKLGSERREIAISISRAWFCLECLDFAQARSILAGILETDDEQLTILLAMRARLLAGWAEFGLGDTERSITWFDEAFERVSTSDFGWFYFPFLHLGMAEALSAAGDDRRAEAELERLMQSIAASPERMWHLRALEFAARFAMAKGDRRAATQNMDRALAMQAGYDLPLASWRIHATAAALFRWLGKTTAARRHEARHNDIVQRLAASFDAGDPLRESFLQKVTSKSP